MPEPVSNPINQPAEIPLKPLDRAVHNITVTILTIVGGLTGLGFLIFGLLGVGALMDPGGATGPDALMLTIIFLLIALIIFGSIFYYFTRSGKSPGPVTSALGTTVVSEKSTRKFSKIIAVLILSGVCAFFLWMLWFVLMWR